MTSTPATAASPATIDAIRRYHVGSVILQGRSQLGVRGTAQITGLLQANAKPPLFIAADQEGGQVQVLRGPGFADIPTAVTQGGYSPATLKQLARIWASQLATAGVNVNLAPVADTVPDPASNPPIGGYQREFGQTPQAVASHVVAFVQGMQAGGADTCAKHFPGLGRVTANTDVSSGVRDTVTTRHDPYLVPFAQAIDAQVPCVMVSTAYYGRIDPARPAIFSPVIVTGMLRHDLGFGGLVITDDVGAAQQVANVSPAQRAVDFIAAGGDIVLTVKVDDIPQMTAAVVARARSDRAFAAMVDAAALRVLQAKRARGLF